jgi:ATP-dependent Lon protease
MPPRPGERIEIPIFPLPATVLFPGALLPLHVFEPRYRAMTRDALQGDRCIAMVLLRDGWEKDYYGVPPVQAIACAAEIVTERALDEGRYNLLLQGTARVRIESEHAPRPYRVAVATVLDDGRGAAPGAVDVRTLLGCCRQLSVQSGELARALPRFEEMAADPAALTDALADAFVADPLERQELLDMLEVKLRVRRLTDALGTLLLAGGLPAIN